MKTKLLTGLALAALAGAPAAEAAPKKGTKVHKGTTTLALDATTAQALTAAGITVQAAKPATLTDGKVAFRVTNGWADPKGHTADVKHVGGITLVKGTTTVTLRNPRLRIAKDASTLTAQVGEQRVEVAKLDTSAATVAVARRSFSFTGVKATLTKAAADALNAAFGTALAEGAPLGELSSASTPRKAKPAPKGKAKREAKAPKGQPKT
jgi:hypothetical protein